ncbi:MAG: AAA family ATPase [Abitibacteriaceae bacterium]|nr:AAA family ATPase [Abditibacteriaceae bacterium]
MSTSSESAGTSSKGITTDASALAGTGIEGLNNVLQGGLPRHRLYLVQGDPGVGKTTLALQFLLAGVKKGERGLYITLSETKEELLAVAESHGWSLEGLDIFELVANEEQLKAEALNTLFHPAEVELTEVTQTLLDEAERVQPSRIVFDSLSELRLLAQSPLRFRRQILALKQHFARREATVLMLDDRTTTLEGVDELQLQSLAHGVIELEHLAPDYGAERRRLRIIKLRGTRYRGGYHDFNIETGGLMVYPRLVAAEHQQNFMKGRVASGIEGLDQLLGGGLDCGTCTLLMGAAGTGKSTLASHYAFSALTRHEPVAQFAFEEGLGTLLARNAALGMDIEPYRQSGQLLLQQIDPAELSPGEFAYQIRQAVEQKGVGTVIIDSLSGYLNAMPEERFLLLHLHELLSYLNQQGVLTLLIMAQYGLLGNTMQSPVDVSYLADTVILLRHFESEGAIRQAISVVKKRSGNHERTIREYRISDRGIQVGEPLRQFQGVLTGVPEYVGKQQPLL